MRKIKIAPIERSDRIAGVFRHQLRNRKGKLYQSAKSSYGVGKLQSSFLTNRGVQCRELEIGESAMVMGLDIFAVLNLVKGKRMNLKDMIFEIHSPEEAQGIYTRLVNEKNFPIGVLFDWNRI